MHDDPTQLPGYAAVEQLYAGSRSTVYRARAETDGRAVVLKLARSGAATLDESLARLRHEMAISDRDPLGPRGPRARCHPARRRRGARARGLRRRARRSLPRRAPGSRSATRSTWRSAWSRASGATSTPPASSTRTSTRATSSTTPVDRPGASSSTSTSRRVAHRAPRVRRSPARCSRARCTTWRPSRPGG